MVLISVVQNGEGPLGLFEALVSENSLFQHSKLCKGKDGALGHLCPRKNLKVPYGALDVLLCHCQNGNP